MITRLIGDVHGHWDKYRALVEPVSASIQVGDFGMGFGSQSHENLNHRFIRGNHDDPSLCRASPNWIPDGTIEDGILFVGGAVSIDAYRRKEGIDWWPDEELTIGSFYSILDMLEGQTINTIISHDCPESVLEHIGSHHMYDAPTRTRQFLQVILETCKPKLMVFGHHHRNMDVVLNGTRFVCLGELQYLDIDLSIM